MAESVTVPLNLFLPILVVVFGVRRVDSAREDSAAVVAEWHAVVGFLRRIILAKQAGWVRRNNYQRDG
jgi:hypothetical protein